MPYTQDEVVDPALQSRRGFLRKALMLGGGALAASGVGVFAGAAGPSVVEPPTAGAREGRTARACVDSTQAVGSARHRGMRRVPV